MQGVEPGFCSIKYMYVEVLLLSRIPRYEMLMHCTLPHSTFVRFSYSILQVYHKGKGHSKSEVFGLIQEY